MQQLLPAISVALQNEAREREFYLENSERTRNAVGREMFARIADEEQRHSHLLQQLHERIIAAGGAAVMIPACVAGTDLRQMIVQLPELASRTTNPDADDIEAIKTAIEFEKEGIERYTQLRDSCTGQDVKDFFDRLAQMERDHYLSLQDSLLFYQDPEQWHNEHEKPLLEG